LLLVCRIAYGKDIVACSCQQELYIRADPEQIGFCFFSAGAYEE
jgi:hypothetical protein